MIDRPLWFRLIAIVLLVPLWVPMILWMIVADTVQMLAKRKS